jgi:hypothetical protein
MNVLPVSLGWSHGGLAESHGLVRDEGDAIVIEYKTKDVLLGAVQTDVKEARIARNDLASVSCQSKWFGLGGCVVVIQTTSLRPSAEIPGSTKGRVELHVDREHAALARKFVEDLRLPGAMIAKPTSPDPDLA